VLLIAVALWVGKAVAERMFPEASTAKQWLYSLLLNSLGGILLLIVLAGSASAE
jgi:hypothetical protein